MEQVNVETGEILQSGATSSPEEKVQWTYRKVIEEARKKLLQQGWPILAEPRAKAPDMQIPEDIDRITDLQLANLSLRYRSWYAYATVQLGFANAELTAVDEVTEIVIGEAMINTASMLTEKLVKDMLKAKAVQEDPKAKAWFTKRIELKQKAQILDSLVSALAIRVKGLENEQIRRASAAKIEMGR